jgi:hypothetical protein
MSWRGLGVLAAVALGAVAVLAVNMVLVSMIAQFSQAYAR